MSESVQQQLVDLIVAQLKTIKTANGYSTDVPDSSVFVWLPVELQASKLPSLSLRDLNCSWEDASLQLYYRQQAFEIVGMTSNDETSHNYVRLLLSDIVKALWNGGDRTWGGLAQTSQIVSSEPVVVQSDRPAAGIRVEFAAAFYHCKADDGMTV